MARPRSRSWALLGFAEVRPPEELAARSALGAARGAPRCTLLWTDEPVVPAAGHVAVVCGEYDATLERLRAAGFVPDPRAEHWGAPRCFVRSPAGHRVEVMAAPPE